MAKKEELCIRCDEPVSVKDPLDYKSLTFDQEMGCLPMHDECFEEIKGRDLWAILR